MLDCITVTQLCIVVVDAVLPAMETKDIRQRFVGATHQKYSYHDDGSLQDDEKRRSPRSRCVSYLWKNFTVVDHPVFCLFAVVLLFCD